MVALSKILRKIRSVVLNYDRELEAESTSRPRPNRQAVLLDEVRTEHSCRSFYASSNQMEIPDPWDDPLI